MDTSLQWSARVSSALCAASRWCSAASLLMMLAAFVLGATAAADTEAASRAGLVLIIAIGAVQVYLAIRIEFDRRIFERVAEARQAGMDSTMPCARWI